MQLFTAGQHSAAFHAFTEAIRLAPTSAVYHCNRAAAGLKLGRPDIAAADADQAVQRDPSYTRGHLRGGRARLQLGQPGLAEACFRRALKSDASCAAAVKGLTEAAEAAQKQQRQAEAEQAAAQLGCRPGLSREALPEEEAVEQLYAAERMLAANPGLQAARCAHVEALLLCQRYADAEAECSSLLEGSADRLYLEAEAAWRQGSLATAADRLRQALQVSQGSGKCSGLLRHVQELQQLEQQAVLAVEDGLPEQCIEACTSLLGQVQSGACVGLVCSVLHRRAEAHAIRQAWEAAISDLDAALALDASHAACLQLRAEAHKQAGAYTSCFLDLQRLKKVAPGTPGLFVLLEEAARLSLGSSSSSSQRTCGDGAAARAGSTSAAEAALRSLGIPPRSTAARARQAYLKLAARWHPDKWGGGSPEEQAAAEERFKEVQQAYELLTGA
jgi:tetratricopeptide (TPR) repeat protein